jgi:hypothetical protein
MVDGRWQKAAAEGRREIAVGGRQKQQGKSRAEEEIRNRVESRLWKAEEGGGGRG